MAAGQVTGTAYVTGNAAEHAFVYSNGTMTDLGVLNGTISVGNGIKARGQVTGYANTTGNASSHAFLYSSGTGMVDLNSLISPTSGWTLNNAHAVSDSGFITGSGTVNGQTHAFLLTPAPESSAFLAFAVGVLGLGSLALRARRRYTA